MRPSTILPVLAFALLVTPLFGGAAAQSAEEDTAWREEERELDQEVHGDGFLLSSTRESELGEDRIDIAFSLTDSEIAYTFGSTEAGNETTIRLLVRLDRLVEFVDADGDGKYGLGDEPVQTFRLPGRGERPVLGEPLVRDGFVATVRYPLPEADGENSSVPIGNQPLVSGEMLVTFRYLPETRAVAGIEMTPTEFVAEIVIERFPYARDGTLLALVTEATTAMGSTDLVAGPRLSAHDGPFEVFYAWTAEDDTDGPTVVGGEETMTAAFAWQRGEPATERLRMGTFREAGVAADIVEALVKGDPVVYGAAALVALVLAGGPAVWRRREG